MIPESKPSKWAERAAWRTVAALRSAEMGRGAVVTVAQLREWSRVVDLDAVAVLASALDGAYCEGHADALAGAPCDRDNVLRGVFGGAK